MYTNNCKHIKNITGDHPYNYANPSVDLSYRAIVNNQIPDYLEINDLSPFINKKMLILLNGILQYNENNRFSAHQILKCSWFNSYYNKYKDRITTATKINQLKPYDSFPYYILNLSFPY